MRRKDWPRKSGLGLGLGVGGGGIGYYLNDSFLDTALAGAVHGTVATPGPGMRTLQDTGGGGIVSVGSGIMSCSGAATGNTDPNRNWDSIARVLGRMAISKHKLVSAAGATSDAVFGIFTASNPASYINNEGGHYQVNGFPNRIEMFNGASSLRVIDSTSNDTYYYHCYILKTTGLYYLAKIGTQWNLIYILNAGASNPVYFSYCAVAAGRHESAIDFIRIPTLLWTPKPISADDFGGTWPTTDGGGLTGLEAGGSGKTWVDNVGVWAIAAGSASCTTAGGVGIATVDSGKSDVYHWAKITHAGGVAGLVTNYVDANNYVKIYHDGVTTVKVDEVVGGVATNRLTYNNAAIAYAADSALVARGIDGGASKSVYVWYKNVFCNAAATISDATIRSATKHGIYTTNNGNTFSEAFTYAVGSGGEYSNPLDMFIN